MLFGGGIIADEIDTFRVANKGQEPFDGLVVEERSDADMPQ